jgi:hypothetical protein
MSFPADFSVDEEPTLDYVDDDFGEAISDVVPSLHSSSWLSSPSGLPISTISWLTHNELLHNAEFVKYNSLIDTLLANAWSNCTIFFSTLGYTF